MDGGEKKMLSEKEKMQAGLPFDGGAPEMMADKSRARTLAERLNHSSEEETELRDKTLRELFGSCGEKIFIKPPFHCDYGYNIHVGENFFANFDCVILDAAPVTIGKNCLMGPQTCIYAVNHPLDVEERLKGTLIPAPVTIGDNVWFGGNCVVLPGVTIGNNVVVGAGSVVTKDVPDDAVIAGNPAKIIKYVNH